MRARFGSGLGALAAKGVAGLFCVGVIALAPGAGAQHVAEPLLTFEHPSDPPLRLPTAVAIGPLGEVCVLDGVHDRVVVFEPDGALRGELRTFGDESLSQPVGLRFAPDGALWIADSGAGRLLVSTLTGELQRVIELPAGASSRRPDPTDLAFAPAGGVWIVDNDLHRLLRLDERSGGWQAFGSEGEALGQVQYPFRAAVSPIGDLFVTDVINGRVQMFGPDGGAVRNVGGFGVEPGQTFRPGGLALDAEGALWVADSVLGVVQSFYPDGAVVGALRDGDGRPLRLEGPLDLAFDGAGDLYVVESRANRVRKFAIRRSAAPGLPAPAPPRPRMQAGQQSKACVICHIEWAPTFADGRDSGLAPAPRGAPDDPPVARADMCLSCHDGSVADSRLRVWEEHGHRTGVAPPDGMTVPSHLPLLDGKLACRTCHSAHGAEAPQGDIRRAVLLRVPNESSQLCASCHVDKTRGPRLGTHPTGGMPWPVPQTLIDAGSRVGPNPRELTCQVCHTPHGARYDHLLVMGVSSNQLCTNCHDQMRPGMFRDGPHAEHPLQARLNAEQAAAVQEMGTRVGPDGQLICLSCHKLHHGKGERFMLADELRDGRMCLRCHSERAEMLDSPHDLRRTAPEERNRLGLTPVEGGPCSSCHLFHRFARQSTPGPGDASGQCITCHQAGACAENKRLTDVNHPSLRCSECHDPHTMDVAMFLRERPETLCSSCHTEQLALVGSGHDASLGAEPLVGAAAFPGDRCLACHRPHGDETHGLFRAPAADQSHSDGACIACHSGAADPDAALALAHPRAPTEESAGFPLVCDEGGSARIGCATCHDPHGAAAHGAEFLLRAPGEDLCVRCHRGMEQVAMTGHGHESMRTHGLAATACGPCHQTHCPDGLRSAQCQDCHHEGGSAPAPVIATHPDAPLFTVTPVGGLPLFNEAGAPDAFGELECRTCHLPHGRADLNLGDAVAGARPLLRPFEARNACTNCHGTDALRRFLYFHDGERRGPAPVGQPQTDPKAESMNARSPRSTSPS